MIYTSLAANRQFDCFETQVNFERWLIITALEMKRALFINTIQGLPDRLQQFAIEKEQEKIRPIVVEVQELMSMPIVDSIMNFENKYLFDELTDSDRRTVYLN